MHVNSVFFMPQTLQSLAGAELAWSLYGIQSAPKSLLQRCFMLKIWLIKPTDGKILSRQGLFSTKISVCVKYHVQGYAMTQKLH